MAVSLITLLIGLSLWIISHLHNFYAITMILVLWTSPLLGLLFTLPFHCSSKYFPTYNNKLNSIFLISQGFGAALFTLFLKLCSNPEDLNLNDLLNKYEISRGLRLLAGCLTIASMFVWVNLTYNKGSSWFNIELNTKLLLDYEIAAQQMQMVSTEEMVSTTNAIQP